MEENKGENINSLCKKYFTPELCDEPVTESKAALKGKILEQLLNFGDWICDKNFSQFGGRNLFCEVVLNTIESCWQNWEKKAIDSYNSYFAFAVRTNVSNHIDSKKEEINKNNISLDEVYNTENSKNTLEESISDKRDLVNEEIEINEALENVEKYLKSVDIWFKSRKREDWNKAYITAELYDGLHQYFDYYPEKKLSVFSFIDNTIYNLSQEPKNKELAKIIDRDEGQLSRARAKFREQVAILFTSSQDESR